MYGWVGMEKEYKVSELASLLGVRDKTIYKYVENGRLNSSKTTLNGRTFTVISIDDTELENLKKYFETIKGKTTVTEQIYEDTLTGENHNNTVINNSNKDKSLELLEKVTDQLIYLQNKVTEYSESHGQVKLLTDSENKTKEEFFKIMQENATLKAKAEQLNEKIIMLEVENQQLKQKSFFGLKFGK